MKNPYLTLALTLASEVAEPILGDENEILGFYAQCESEQRQVPVPSVQAEVLELGLGRVHGFHKGEIDARLLEIG